MNSFLKNIFSDFSHRKPVVTKEPTTDIDETQEPTATSWLFRHAVEVRPLDRKRTWNSKHFPLIKAGLVDGDNSFNSTNLTVKGLNRRLHHAHIAYLLTCDSPTAAMIGFFDFACITIVYTFFFWLGGDECTSSDDMSFKEAFFLSIQSISTVGYGSISATSYYCNILVLMQSWNVILLLAFFTSLLFVNVIRPDSGMMVFSDVACLTDLHENNTPPVLTFQLCKKSISPVCAATITCVLWDYSRFPSIVRKEIKVEEPHIEWLDFGVTSVHVVDSTSPLLEIANYGRLYDKLPTAFNILVTINGSHPSTGAVVSRVFCYNCQNILLGREFVPMIVESETEGMYVDVDLLSTTESEVVMKAKRKRQVAKAGISNMRKLIRTLPSSTSVGQSKSFCAPSPDDSNSALVLEKSHMSTNDLDHPEKQQSIEAEISTVMEKNPSKRTGELVKLMHKLPVPKLKSKKKPGKSPSSMTGAISQEGGSPQATATGARVSAGAGDAQSNGSPSSRAIGENAPMPSESADVFVESPGASSPADICVNMDDPQDEEVKMTGAE